MIKGSRFSSMSTYRKWLKLPSEDKRFYSFLPQVQVDKLNNFYINNPHLYKAHYNDIQDKWYGNDDVTRKANEYLNQEFKHEKWLKENIKYRYDQFFMYVELWNDYFVILYYEKWGKRFQLARIMFIDTLTEEEFAFGYGKFKTALLMMLPAETIKFDRYVTAYDKFYNHYQRLQHPDTIKLIKSFDKFKYLPIEKLTKINYFKLLNAASPALYQYELLIKIGATRLASDLLMNRQLWNKEKINRFKDKLKKNHTLEYYENIINAEIIKANEKKRLLELK
ncbi:MAG: hypothetical protein AB7E61_06225, partial [Acholeplasmataceae bacterium]